MDKNVDLAILNRLVWSISRNSDLTYPPTLGSATTTPETSKGKDRKADLEDWITLWRLNAAGGPKGHTQAGGTVSTRSLCIRAVESSLPLRGVLKVLCETRHGELRGRRNRLLWLIQNTKQNP